MPDLKLEPVVLPDPVIRTSGPCGDGHQPSRHNPDPDPAVEVRPETNPMLKLIPLAALGFGLAACVPSQHPSHLVTAADPAVGAHQTDYSSVTAGVRAYDVVEPLDWRELNRRVTPGAASEPMDSNDAARRGR